ncbi:GNAT family N-acetyltransferase [Amycolatopsis minnesotensis]|uniref:N-acetyltransferase domain-containing protein n=1 Tax=Amycolatopsis minnesotensis TaxID=337894 RepID=A0ABP5EBZ7_9PSEU
MSTGLGAARTEEPPRGYTVEIREGEATLDVLVRAGDGGKAASGRVALWDSSATIDQVVTEPAHRRRGLGRLVMGALGSAAAARGATHAVLVASEDGHGLYTALGWAVDTPLTAAHVPENPVAAGQGHP